MTVFLPGKYHGQRGSWWVTFHVVAKDPDMTQTRATTTNLFVINNLNKLLYCKNIYIYFGRIFQGIKVFLQITLHLSPDIYKTISYNNIYQQINI